METHSNSFGVGELTENPKCPKCGTYMKRDETLEFLNWECQNSECKYYDDNYY